MNLRKQLLYQVALSSSSRPVAASPPVRQPAPRSGPAQAGGRSLQFCNYDNDGQLLEGSDVEECKTQAYNQVFGSHRNDKITNFKGNPVVKEYLHRAVLVLKERNPPQASVLVNEAENNLKLKTSLKKVDEDVLVELQILAGVKDEPTKLGDDVCQDFPAGMRAKCKKLVDASNEGDSAKVKKVLMSIPQRQMETIKRHKNGVVLLSNAITTTKVVVKLDFQVTVQRRGKNNEMYDANDSKRVGANDREMGNAIDSDMADAGDSQQLGDHGEYHPREQEGGFKSSSFLPLLVWAIVVI